MFRWDSIHGFHDGQVKAPTELMKRNSTSLRPNAKDASNKNKRPNRDYTVVSVVAVISTVCLSNVSFIFIFAG